MRIRTLTVCLSVLLSSLSCTALAQQIAYSASGIGVSLPEAPTPQQNISAANPASISGIVQDTDGAAIPAAQIILFLNDGKQLQTVKSDIHGRFIFPEVPAGAFYITVEASGFALSKTKEFTVAAQQSIVL
ncbi:MAG TPA: carboxypeptidase-like regulatory domain-containing protein, partial [Edaphobacter sp.]